jgi:hypothetical protein
MPASKMRSRPQVYPRLAFHIVRTIAFISASVVSGILIYFCIQLRHDGFKLPWTFIIVRQPPRPLRWQYMAIFCYTKIND